ncbi:MAG: hypothetical protein AAF208_07075 [Cyanobacteria bacterium P01_A01_bin.45]
MQGQMCWLSAFGKDGEKILHLKTSPQEHWKPYTAFGNLMIPDYRIPGGSKGYATYQKLLKSGWELVSSQVEEEKRK